MRIIDWSSDVCSSDLTTHWFCVDVALKEEKEVNSMLKPYLGGYDPVFGRLFTGYLTDFFDEKKLAAIQPAGRGLNILYGSGAALARSEERRVWKGWVRTG